MSTRREFVKRIPYVAPAVLTLAAAPEYAKAGSAKSDSRVGGDKSRDSDWDFGWGKNKDKGPKDKDDKKGGKAKGKDKD